MSTGTVLTGDPISRAYANLKAIRDNLGSGFVHEEGFYQQYRRALDELQNAGVDVREWQLSHNAVGSLDANEFRAKIDAIFILFHYPGTQEEDWFPSVIPR